MDIPSVLAVLCPTADWGPCSGSNSTYEQLAATWRDPNVPCPTLEQMLAVAVLPPVPDKVAIWRMKAVLASRGLIDTIDSYVESNKTARPDIYYAWEYSPDIYRRSPFVLALAPSINLSDTDLDSLFREAAAILA